jgi:hypothetical protein
VACERELVPRRGHIERREERLERLTEATKDRFGLTDNDQQPGVVSEEVRTWLVSFDHRLVVIRFDREVRSSSATSFLLPCESACPASSTVRRTRRPRSRAWMARAALADASAGRSSADLVLYLVETSPSETSRGVAPQHPKISRSSALLAVAASTPTNGGMPPRFFSSQPAAVYVTVSAKWLTLNCGGSLASGAPFAAFERSSFLGWLQSVRPNARRSQGSHGGQVFVQGSRDATVFGVCWAAVYGLE